MHMGMVRRVMKGSIPSEILGTDFHVPGDGVAVHAQQRLPLLHRFISQPGGVFPTERQDMRPYVTWMIRDFLHRRRLSIIREQTVGRQLGCAGPVGDVILIPLPGSEQFPVHLRCPQNELIRISLRGIQPVVFRLVQFPDVGIFL